MTARPLSNPMPAYAIPTFLRIARQALATGLLLVGLAVATGPARAQLFPTWDTDDNGLLTEREFLAGARMQGLFDRWDADGNGAIDAREFREGVFQAWDVNDNGVLNVTEWDNGADAYFGEAPADFALEVWDPDGDGTITRREFDSAMRQVGVFALLESDTDDDRVLADAADSSRGQPAGRGADASGGP